MDPSILRDYLAVLSAANVKRAKIGDNGDLEVEFHERPESLSPFVNVNGAPVDLDEGMPALARDDYDPAALQRANLTRKAT
jgi:hypothetical protein